MSADEAREVLRSFDAVIARLRSVDLDEASTFERLAVRARLEAWDAARAIVVDVLGEPGPDVPSLAPVPWDDEPVTVA